jgi:50S ribosomal protein L16 3-hydroxylase
MSASIGFRAPTGRELVESFLQFLPESLAIAGTRYADPDLRDAAAGPHRRHAAAADGRDAAPCALDRTVVERFLGCLLSEPKADVFFDPPPLRLRCRHSSASPPAPRMAPCVRSGGADALR